MNENQDKGQSDGITMELDRYRQSQCNLLIPEIAIGGLSIFHKPVVDKITLSVDPKQGDVYNDSNAHGLVISGKGLAKLATTAGIIWDHNRCRRVDDRRDRNYCAYRAIGGLRKPDGAVVWADASYDIDFDVLHDQLLEKYTAKAKQDKKGQEWIDYCVNRDFQQKLTHKLKLCETGAKNRVIRKLLGLKGTYNPNELKNPFVCPRIVFQPDYNDPMVKEKMIDAHIASMTGLYGPSSVQSEDYDHPEPASDPEEQPPLTRELDPDMPDVDEDIVGEASQRDDFLNADLEAKVQTLKELARRKRYDLSTIKRPMDQWADQYLVEFYDKLVAIQDDGRPF